MGICGTTWATPTCAPGTWDARIASYRQGASLQPRNQDIQANLSFARQSRKDALESNEASPVRSLFFWYFGTSRLELLQLLVLSNLLFWTLLWLRQRRPASELLGWSATLAGILFLVFALSFGHRLLFPERVAVVIAPEVAVRAGTNEEATVRFKLHAGAEVSWNTIRDDWVRIMLPDGKQGWLNKSDLKTLRI